MRHQPSLWKSPVLHLALCSDIWALYLFSPRATSVVCCDQRKEPARVKHKATSRSTSREIKQPRAALW